MSETASHESRGNSGDGSSGGSDQDRDYQKYIDERNWLIRSSFEQQRDLDKWLMTLAGGALVLSWTAASWLLTESNLECIFFLVLGWVCLVASLLSTIFSMRFSVDAYDGYCKVLDDTFGRQGESGNEVWDEVIKGQNALPYNSRVECLNKASLWFLFAGLLLVTLFVGLNIPGGSTDAGEEKSAAVE